MYLQNEIWKRNRTRGLIVIGRSLHYDNPICMLLCPPYIFWLRNTLCGWKQNAKSRRTESLSTRLSSKTAQKDKNYGKEGAEIIVDNTQITLFGGFAHTSGSAEILSKALESRRTAWLNLLALPLIFPHTSLGIDETSYLVLYYSWEIIFLSSVELVW